MLRRAAIGLIMKGAGLVGGTAGARTAAVRAFSLAAPVFAPAVPSPARGMWGGLLLLRSRGMCSAAPTDENPPADKPAPRSPMLNMLQKWRRPNFEHGGDIMSQRVEERKLPAAHRIDDWWTDNHGVDIRSTRKPWEDARYPELAEAEYKWRKSKGIGIYHVDKIGVDAAMRRLNKILTAEGVMQRHRNNQRYVKPCQRRRKAVEQSKYKQWKSGIKKLVNAAKSARERGF